MLHSYTPILDDIDVSENDTSDSEYVLVESSMPIQVARYSLFIPMIEDGIKLDTVDSNTITSNKSSEFSYTDCGYVVAFNFLF